MLKDVGLLTLRLVSGGLLMGHGAQKLFGKFGGHGLAGTADWLESLGVRPGKPWAMIAGASELGGGLLTALGLLGPVGNVAAIAPMAAATRKAHAGKPIWVTEGGAELPVLNVAVSSALALTGPGRLSLDGLLGLQTPKRLVALTAFGVAGGLIWLESRRAAAQDTTAPAEPTPETAISHVELRDGQAPADLTPAGARR